MQDKFQVDDLKAHAHAWLPLVPFCLEQRGSGKQAMLVYDFS